MLLVLSLFSFALLSAQADVTITMEHETNGKKVDTTLFFAGEQVRMDSPQGGMILTPSRDEMIMVMHQQKQYMKRSLKQTAAMTQTNEAVSEAITFEKTGAQQVINGFSCEQVIGTEVDGDVTEFWVSKDSVHTDKFLSSMKVFDQIQGNQRGGSQMDAWNQFFKQYPELSTFPIRTINKNAAGAVDSVTTVKSISEDKIPANRFEVPAGYGELIMPNAAARVTPQAGKVKPTMPAQSHSEVLKELQALQKEIQSGGGQPTPAQIQRLQELAKQYKVQ